MASPSFQPSALSYEQVGEPPQGSTEYSQLSIRRGAGRLSNPLLPAELHPAAMSFTASLSLQKAYWVSTHVKAVLMIGGIALVALLPFRSGPLGCEAVQA